MRFDPSATMHKAETVFVGIVVVTALIFGAIMHPTLVVCALQKRYGERRMIIKHTKKSNVMKNPK